MGRIDPELKGLMERVSQLIVDIVREGMEKEEARERLAGINQEMLENHSHALVGIGVLIEVIAVGAEGAEKKAVKVNLQFGESSEDKKWGEYLRLSPKDFEEMGQIAKGIPPGEEKKENSPEFSAPPETLPSSDLNDPRSNSQIASSLRKVARVCSPLVRRAFIERIQGEWTADIKFPKAEQLSDNRIWLQIIQKLINEIQELPPPLDRAILLKVEGLFLRWSKF